MMMDKKLAVGITIDVADILRASGLIAVREVFALVSPLAPKSRVVVRLADQIKKAAKAKGEPR